MNKACFLSIVLFLSICVSCLSEDYKEERAHDMARIEMQSIDMDSVDRYPVFDNCDEMLTTSDCFYKTLFNVIDQKLRKDYIAIQLEQKDSVYASISVDNKGVIEYDGIFKCARSIDKERLDSILKDRLADFPVIKSAVKRSIPVSTTYRLPIVFIPVDSLEN